MTTDPAWDERTVVVGVGEEPDVLVQDYSLRHVTWAVLSPLMLKLVRYDDHWRPWPELAESIPDWRTLDDGGTEVRWKLRRGLRWHDGTPVTASDALFTYELLKATPPPYPHHTIVESITDMLVPDDDPYTLVVRWKPEARFARFEEWGTVLPRHLLEGAGLEQPDTRESHPFMRAPVFHGPYRFAGWEPGERIELEAAQPHPHGDPGVDRLVFRFFPDPAALCDAVVEGSVDVTDLTGFGPPEAERIAAERPDLEIHETSSFSWEHVDFDLADPTLADVRVRRAIAHAIDKQELSDRLYGGRYEPADSWLPPRHPAYNPDIPRYGHDPDRARELLRAAGWGGRRLPLRMTTTAPPSGGTWTSSATRPQLAELMAEQLARVGIDLEIELVPAGELFPRLRKRDVGQLTMFAWSMGLETTGYLMWHSDKIPDGEDWYGLNIAGWRHPENDRILDVVADTAYPDRRFALMARQQLIWGEELPALPLFFPPSISTAKPGLRNIRPVGVFGSYVTWNCWEWSWDETRLSPASAASRSAGSATSRH